MGITYYIRGEFYREKAKDYVGAAIATGVSDGGIMFRHILPNALTPVVSFAPFIIVANIGSLVALDFLGFGLPAPTPSWGELIGQGMENLTKWWLVFYPLGALFLTLLLVVFIGEAVREAFDPQGVLAPPMTHTPLTLHSRAAHLLRHRGRRGQGRRRRRPRHARRRSARARRRVGLRQERHGVERAAAHPQPAGPHRRRRDHAARAGTCSRCRGRRCARSAAATISMIFQEPMTSLNPVFTIGMQLTEVILQHEAVSDDEAARRAVAMLTEVGIPDAERRMTQYPHHLSGGMRQRVMIAMALVLNPDLLIADEPTTALDVTIQAQILDLMLELKERRPGASILLITHNLAVVAETCDRVAVMYGGKIQEIAPVQRAVREPAAPLHAGAAGLDSARDGRTREAPHRDSRQRAEHSRPAGRLQVRDTLPAPIRAVRGHRAAAHRDRAGPFRPLPSVPRLICRHRTNPFSTLTDSRCASR